MGEEPEIIATRLRELSVKVFSWHLAVSEANEFQKVAEELDSCADQVGLVEENKSLRDQIVDLRYKLELEKNARRKPDERVAHLEREEKRTKKLLKLYGLCDLFNYYFTVPAIKNSGKSSYQEFVSDYSILIAQVKDKEKTQDDLDAFVFSVNQFLNGIDVRLIIQACKERHELPHTDVRAKTDQERFLEECSKFDFGEHSNFAKALHAELQKVTLRRKN